MKEEPKLIVEEVNKPELSETDWYLLAYALYPKIKKFYEDPENIRRFEEWKKNKEKEKSGNDNQE